MRAVLASILLLASSNWKEVMSSDGITVETRERADSRFPEIRATTTVSLSVEALCAGAFGTGLTDKREPSLQSRRVLSETEDERVTFDRIAPPIVSDRDYAVRVRRIRGNGGKCQVTADLANELAPPPSPGVVRIKHLHLVWDFAPNPDGGTRLTYVVWTDPNTILPTFSVEPSLRSVAVDWVKLIIERARSSAPAK